MANGSKYTLLHQEEIQCIRLQNGVPVSLLKDGSSSVLNMPLNSLEALLPDFFFRVNRNALVHLREVKGFVAEKSGKLLFSLLSRKRKKHISNEITAPATKAIPAAIQTISKSYRSALSRFPESSSGFSTYRMTNGGKVEQS